MKLGIYIDYANLSINSKKINGFKDRNEIDEHVCKVIDSIEKYVEQYKKNKKITIVEKKAYVLPDKSFGKPEEKLSKHGIQVIRVKNAGYKKTDAMKENNSSRRDDSVLMDDVRKSIQNNSIHGVIVVSNDGDFASLGEKVIHEGRYFWSAVYEGKGVKPSSKLMKQSEICLHIKDILNNSESGDADEELIEDDDCNYNGERLEFYKEKKRILVYPIQRKNISLGRRSIRRNHIPNIDLTSFDIDKVISRQHANIYKVGKKIIFSIDNNCTRGTWYKLQPKIANQQFELEVNETVVLGSADGFAMIYRND